MYNGHLNVEDEVYSEVMTSKRGKKRNTKKRASKQPVSFLNSNRADASEDTNSLENTDSNVTDENESEDCGLEIGNELENCSLNKDEEDTVSVDAILNAPPKIQLPPEPIKSEDKPVEDETEHSKPEIFPSDEEHSLPREINKRALPKGASTYELEKFEKNALIIFNQENIEGYKPRLGTEKDVVSLKKTFENYGFEVVEHKDFTKDEVFKELKAFSERDFTDYGCIAVAVLTHGSTNGLLRAKDQQYSEIEIINHFKVYDKPSLVTKPKILIIQACRGTKGMQGVPVFLSGKVRKDLDEDLEPYILPVESDMLVLHSSYIGNPSHRDELHGSWFIQSLCNKIGQLSSTHDLESIITEVKREVAIDKYHEEYNRRTFEMDKNKQMPVLTSTLIRKLYLKKFRDVPPIVKVSPNITISSKNDVLDTTAPNTPLLVQFGPCSCFLDHYTYIKDCLRFYLDDHPGDQTAQSFLEVANSLEDLVEHNNAKEKVSKAICKHLSANAKDCIYYKYFYFYKHLDNL